MVGKYLVANIVEWANYKRIKSDRVQVFDDRRLNFVIDIVVMHFLSQMANEAGRKLGPVPASLRGHSKFRSGAVVNCSRSEK